MEINIRPLMKGLLLLQDANEDYKINQANDLTIASIKDELASLEKDGGLSGMRVCSSFHGGPLDYPKMVNSATGLVSLKWDICFERIQQNRRRAMEKAHDDSDDEVFAEISVNHEEPKTQEVEDFISTVNESASKLYEHSVRMVYTLLEKGDCGSLLIVLGGISLMRNKMWAYNQVLYKAFDKTYSDYCRLLDAVSEQVLEYISAMISTTVLHDPSSQDWNNPKEFYEGEKISHCVRMWGFVLRGYKNDLWTILPPKTAQKIYASIFDESLGILTSRYSTLTPSLKRIAQYRGDISFILSTVIDALNHIMGVSLSKVILFRNEQPHPQNQIIRSIHNKALVLHQCLTTIAAPMEHLQSYKTENVRKVPKISKSDSSCLRFLRNETDEDPISLLVRTISCHPEPLWPMIVQALFSKNKVLSFTILEGIGNFIPNTDGELQVSVNCGGVQCSNNCVDEAQRWPLTAVFGIMRILSQMPDNDSLSTGIFRVLKKSKTSWKDCFSGSSIWNTNNKPVWFTALVHILEPYLSPVVCDLIDLLNSEEPWPVSTVPKALERSIDLLKDVIAFIPNSVLKALQSVDDISNGGGNPLCDSVHIHFIFTSLYGIITRLQYFIKLSKAPRERLDFVIAFGEALCSLRPSPSLGTLRKLMKECNTSEEHDDKLLFSNASLERLDNEYSYILAENIANDLLSDESGRFALAAAHKFILNNVEWTIQALLSKECVEIKRNTDPLGIFTSLNNDEEYLMRSYDWEDMIHYTRENGNPQMIIRLFQRRPELNHPEGASNDKELRDLLNDLTA